MGGAITASQHAGGPRGNLTTGIHEKTEDGSPAAEQEDGISVKELMINIRRIVVFVLISWVFYSPFGTRWFNNPVTGWDTNRTAASWDTTAWDWDFIDCFYVCDTSRRNPLPLGSEGRLAGCTRYTRDPPCVKEFLPTHTACLISGPCRSLQCAR